VSEEKPRVDINVVQVVASALAAVSSAVLLSTVGVAGTVIGAAVGSVIATVGSAVYSYSLHVSRERVAAAAQVAAMARVRRGGQGQDPRATQQLSEQQEADAEKAARPSLRETLSKLPWKRVAVAATGVFLVAMVVIVGFELVSGRAVSTYTGGSRTDTPRTSFGGHASKPRTTPTPSPSGSDTASPSGSESPTASATASSTESPTTPTAGATSPTGTPSGSLSASASSSPSSSPTSSAGASHSASPGSTPSP
jgi:hypothetical protein